MSEDLSSDEDWRVSTANLNYDVRSQVYDPQSHLKCWECGKLVKDLTNLVEHYKSHNIDATCHVCKITFCRLISLSTHLENVHSPPRCNKCRQMFISVWELNKHAETPCDEPKSCKKGSRTTAVAKQKGKTSHNSINKTTVEKSTNSTLSVQKMKMKQEEGSETPNHDQEYKVGGDDNDDDDDNNGRPASSASEEVAVRCLRKNKRVDYDESNIDSDSSSTDCSSDPPSPQPPKSVPTPPHKNLMCTACGRGPFRSIKLHQLHCSGLNLKYQCFQCKLVFLSDESLKEHHMPLYSCHVCGQVFSHETMLDSHPCPKDSRSPLVLFCPEAMPKVCSICKCFFTSEKTLLDHVTGVHVSVVSTKVCIITNPSLLNDKKVSAGFPNADGKSALSGSNQVFNGKLPVDQTYADSQTAPVKSSPSSSHPNTPPVPICLIPATSEKADDRPGTPTNQRRKSPSLRSLPPRGDAETSGAARDAESPPSPTILALFENDSLALTRRTKASWRLKSTYPCRQCGAILRHASLIISHRYLHRGKRSHRCQCGRSFRHRLHLLRHCVQHAEAVSYICVSCGDTFTGAKLLAEHLRGKSPKTSRCQRKRKSKGNRKCKMTLTCDCGLLFFRPSAYIWHQLQNETKS